MDSDAKSITAVRGGKRMNIGAVGANSNLQHMLQSQSATKAQTAAVSDPDHDGDTDPIGSPDSNDSGSSSASVHSGVGRYVNVTA